MKSDSGRAAQSDQRSAQNSASLGVILARAGSAGLAGKHLRELLGRKVIEYTFEHARASRSLSRVVVSTDCPIITKLAEREGFETIARPAVLATADASVQASMLHALHEMERRDSGLRVTSAVVLYGNIPVRPAGVIDRALDMLSATHCDSVRSWCPVGKWHPGWMARLNGDRVEALQPGSVHRRQDLPELFLHDGAVVAVTRVSLLRGEAAPDDPHAFFGVDRRGFQTEAGDTVEIDQLRDLYWAEAVLRDRAPSQAKVA